MDQLALSDFEPHIGSVFKLDNSDNPGIDLVLATAEKITTSSSNPLPGGRPFSLIFRGPAESSFEQGIRPLSHPVMGFIEIFLVPIQPDATGALYEAVFS